MSRRHHGRSRHARGRSDELPRAQAGTEPRAVDAIERAAAPIPAVPEIRVPVDVRGADPIGPRPVPPAVLPGQGQHPGNGLHVGGQPDGIGQRMGCTAPQLRRFIKSRPYVPMHELRRRFGINGAEDDVTPLPLDVGSVYVGLPERECRLLGELVRGGEVGYELSLDPRTPIVVGVYPMRPVPRA